LGANGEWKRGGLKSNVREADPPSQPISLPRNKKKDQNRDSKKKFLIPNFEELE